jgi:putative endonuclease
VAFYVYLLASGRNGTLYAGSTDDLPKRLFQHQSKTGGKFTAKYGVATLVWYEVHETRESARIRENQIKKWNRDWKLALIERDNPDWLDRIGEFA